MDFVAFIEINQHICGKITGILKVLLNLGDAVGEFETVRRLLWREGAIEQGHLGYKLCTR